MAQGRMVTPPHPTPGSPIYDDSILDWAEDKDLGVLVRRGMVTIPQRHYHQGWAVRTHGLEDRNMRAREFLEKAAELVSGDRERTHGDKARNFGNIASLWTAYLTTRRDPSKPLSPEDVGKMMVLLKIARMELGDYNPDDILDACGYAACIGEIAEAAKTTS